MLRTSSIRAHFMAQLEYFGEALLVHLDVVHRAIHNKQVFSFFLFVYLIF